MPVVDKNNLTEVQRFEDFVMNSEYGHSMQSMNWAKVKNNWDSDYVYVEDSEGNIEGSLSIISVKNDGKNAFLYAPRGPVCDFYDTDLVNRLIKEAEEVVERRNGFLLRMDPEVLYDEDLVEKLRQEITADNFAVRTRGSLEDEHDFTNPRNNMIMDLSGKTVDSLLEEMSGDKRYRIRRSYRDGVKTRRVRWGDENFQKDLDLFYDLTVFMADRHEINHRPKEYFARLMESFGDNAVMYFAEDEEEALACALVVFHKMKAFYMYAASVTHKAKKNASVQLNIEAMQDAIRLGIPSYDFGGVYHFTTENGLYNYKHWYTGPEGHKEFIGELDIIYDQEKYDNFNAQ